LEQTGLSEADDEKMKLMQQRRPGRKRNLDPQETVPRAFRPRRKAAKVAQERVWLMVKAMETQAFCPSRSCVQDVKGAAKQDGPPQKANTPIAVVMKIAGVVIGEKRPAIMPKAGNRKKQRMQTVTTVPSQTKTMREATSSQKKNGRGRAQCPQHACTQLCHLRSIMIHPSSFLPLVSFQAQTFQRKRSVS
jgi:hypothetical protein